MRSQKARPPQGKARAETVEVPGVVVGRLAQGSTPEAPQVEFDEHGGAPIEARTAVALDTALVERAVATRRGVLLQFERGKLDRPIIVGLLQEPASLLTELLTGTAKTPGPQQPARRQKAEAKVDGKRVVLEAEREIELRCGDASITLSSDGKIIVKGAYVETYSRGVNRIKGGAVKIN